MPQRSSILIVLSLFVFHAFGQFGTLAPIDFDSSPAEDILHGDLTADGLEDILLLQNSAGAQSYLRNAGAGDLSEHVQLPSFPEPATGHAIADVDMDGDMDILALIGDMPFGTQRFASLINDGTGSFTYTAIPMLPLAGTQGLTVVDFDADGDPDLVTWSWATQTMRISLFRNNGNGTFAAAQTLQESANQVQKVLVHDVDGDGDHDVLTGSNTEIRWLRNDGALPLEPATVILNSFYYGGMVAFGAALDGIGGALVVTSNDKVSVYSSSDGGTTWNSVDLMTVPMAPPVVVVDDREMDGDVDVLVFSGSQFQWYVNDGGGAFTPVVMSGFTLVPDPFWDDVLYTHVITMDLDQDGDRDVIEQYFQRLNVYTFNGVDHDAPRPVVPQWSSDVTFAALLDVDADGLMDIVHWAWAGRSLGWYRNEGTGGWSQPHTLSNTAALIGSMVANDMDGDGDEDLLFSDHEGMKWYEVVSGATPLGPHMLGLAPWPAAVLPVDMDGDGDKDLVYYTQNAGDGTWSCTWQRNDGSGAYSGSIPVGEGQENGVTGFMDLDGDGAPEAVITTADGVVFLPNDGSGVFGAAVPAISAPFPGSVFLHDRDADGDNDILIFGYDGSSWHDNDGTGGFTQGPSMTGADHLTGWSTTLERDIDQDGLLDIVLLGEAMGWDDPYNVILFFRNTGNGFAPAVNLLTQNITILEITGMFAQPLYNTTQADLLLVASGRVHTARNFADTPYQVRGTVFQDNNGNGVQDAGEQGLQGFHVDADPATTGAFTDAEGAFTLLALEGTYDVHVLPPISPELWTSTTPLPIAVQLTEQDPVVGPVHIGLQALVDTSIIVPTLWIGDGPCGDQAEMILNFTNSGTRIEQGTIALALDPAFTFLSAVPPPDSIVDGVYWWGFTELLISEMGALVIQLTTPPVEAMGSEVLNTFTVTTLDPGGEVTGSFEASFGEEVDCAYDPNKKEVRPAGYGGAHAVPIDTDRLEYTIHFQNTGTATAYDVELLDLLDPALDVDRLEVIGHSHPPTHVGITANKQLVVRFDDIMLPDSVSDPMGSQGFITFRIGVLPGLPHLTAIENTVGIYFDLNPPIITNTTLSTLVDCGLWQPSITELSPGVLDAGEGDAYQWFFSGEAMVSDTLGTLVAWNPGLYGVSITSIHGCSAFVEHEVTVVGVEERDHVRLAVIPNPFHEQARLVANEVLTERHLIEVMDVHGRRLHARTGNGTREVMLDGAPMASGLYLVRITHAGEVRGTVRIVVR